MAADRGDTAGQGVERVSGVRLTAGEREAIEDAWDGSIRNRTITVVEQILTARLAPVEALADAWETTAPGKVRIAFLCAADELRAALAQPTAAPSPDREPGPTPSEES